MTDFTQEPGYPDFAYDKAMWHLNRAAATEGVAESGLWRAAIVESLAAVTIALFSVADAIQSAASKDD